MVNVRYYDDGDWTGVETDATNSQQAAHQSELPVRPAYMEDDTELPDYDSANQDDKEPKNPGGDKPKNPGDDKPKKPGDDKPKKPGDDKPKKPGDDKPNPKPEPCPHPPGHFPDFPDEPPHCGPPHCGPPHCGPPHHHHPPHHRGPPGCGRGGRGGFPHHGPHGGRGGFPWGGRGGFPWGGGRGGGFPFGGGRGGGMMPPQGFMGQLGNDARFHMNAFHEAMRDGNNASSDDNGGSISGEIDFRPRVDVFDTPEAWILHVALPGAAREDVGVTWEPALGAVRIGGVVHRMGDEAFLKTISSAERDVGVFERVVRLGERGRGAAVVDPEAISARMMDGVLVVEVPKGEAEKAEARKVEIL